MDKVSGSFHTPGQDEQKPVFCPLSPGVISTVNCSDLPAITVANGEDCCCRLPANKQQHKDAAVVGKSTALLGKNLEISVVERTLFPVSKL